MLPNRLLQPEEFSINHKGMAMHALIFANGEYCPDERTRPSAGGRLVIAADGGSQHCQQLGILPDVLIGDLDSTAPGLVEDWESRGVEIIRYPPEKDQTDLELALLLAQGRGATSIKVYGAMGGRWDMAFGNLTLLGHPDLHVPITLVCGNDRIRLLHPGESLDLKGRAGDTVSLIPLQSGPCRIRTRGLQYALNGENLEFGFSRGISNSLTGDEASVSLESGLLVVFHSQSAAEKED
jgi:thiamine pyrophosphokinase